MRRFGRGRSTRASAVSSLLFLAVASESSKPVLRPKQAAEEVLIAGGRRTRGAGAANQNAHNQFCVRRNPPPKWKQPLTGVASVMPSYTHPACHWRGTNLLHRFLIQPSGRIDRS